MNKIAKYFLYNCTIFYFLYFFRETTTKLNTHGSLSVFVFRETMTLNC